MKNKVLRSVNRLYNAFVFSDRYQAYNTCMNFFERTLQKTSMVSYPFIVQVDVTNRCNLNCVFCIRHTHTLQLGDLAPELISEIVKLSRKSRDLILFGYGEPLIAEPFHELLRDARSARVSFTTNGLLLTEKMIRRVTDGSNRPIHSITFSIDGIKPETYLSIRENSDYNKVWKNLRKLAERRSHNHGSWPEIWINYVAMRRNIEELPKLVEQAAGSGVSQINVFHLVVWDDSYKDESLIHYPKLTKQMFSEARRKARNLGVRLDVPTEISASCGINGIHKKDVHMPRCYQPWSYVYIRYDGYVQACCFSENLVMGNIAQKSFNEIWNDEPYRQLRSTVNRSPIKDCLRCEQRYRYTPSPNDIETYIKLQARKK